LGKILCATTTAVEMAAPVRNILGTASYNMEVGTIGSNICMLPITKQNISDPQKAACYIHIIRVIVRPHLSNRTKFIMKISTYYITARIKLNTVTTEFICEISSIPFSQKKIFYMMDLTQHVGPGSSVSIATDYGLQSPGIESWWGRDFLHTSSLDLGPTQPPVQWVTGLSRG
jgi:hypothetical protein